MNIGNTANTANVVISMNSVNRNISDDVATFIVAAIMITVTTIFYDY